MPFFCLSILCLLLTVRPAQAQGSYSLQPCQADGTPLTNSPQDANHFYLMSGTVNGQTINTYPQHAIDIGGARCPPSVPYNNTPASSIGARVAADNLLEGGWFYYPTSGDTTTAILYTGTDIADLSGQLVYYFKATWPGTGPAPGYITLLLQTNVSASADITFDGNPIRPQPGLSASATATDGSPFNETLSADGTNNPSPITGHHLVRASVDPKTGIAEVYLNGKTHEEAINAAVYALFRDQQSDAPLIGSATTDADSFVSAGVRQDPGSRDVTISCPAVDTNPDGGSQYRDPPLTGPVIVNARQPDGSLRGDTLLLSVKSNDQVISPTQSFTYHANISGTWASSGTYHWFSDLTGYSDSGSLPTVTDFNDTIPYTTTAGSVDHIFISMYDGVDGAEATGNYHLHLHAQYEPSSWPEDSGSPYKVMGPDPDVPSWPTYPWKNISPLNEGVFPTTSFPVTYKEPGIESVDGGLDLGADPVVLHFGVTGNPTSSFPYANTLTPQPALMQGQETWVVSREIVARHKGHLDIYGTHGYTSTGVWRHDIMQGIEVNLYQPYPTTNTLAFDPATNWNPPGY